MSDQTKRLADALRKVRPYVLTASERLYDGTHGHGIRKEAKRRLANLDAALATHDAQPAQDAVAGEESEIQRVVDAAWRFRDSVVNQRYQLEEPCLDGDQTHAVLGLFDDLVGAELVAIESQHAQDAGEVERILAQYLAACGKAAGARENSEPPEIIRTIQALNAEVAQLKAEVERLRDALIPFADLEYKFAYQGPMVDKVDRARKALAGATESGWISVEERLPNHSNIVLGYWPNYAPSIEPVFYADGEWRDEDRAQISAPTMWRETEFPPAPEGAR